MRRRLISTKAGDPSVYHGTPINGKCCIGINANIPSVYGGDIRAASRMIIV